MVATSFIPDRRDRENPVVPEREDDRRGKCPGTGDAAAVLNFISHGERPKFHHPAREGAEDGGFSAFPDLAAFHRKPAG